MDLIFVAMHVAKWENFVMNLLYARQSDVLESEVYVTRGSVHDPVVYLMNSCALLIC